MRWPTPSPMSANVVCMDVAGRGQSEWLPHKRDYSFGLYLTHAATLLASVTAPVRASRIRRMFVGSRRRPHRHVDWVDTSMGGLMGMMLAAKRHSPIRRLVTMSGPSSERLARRSDL